MTYQYLFDWCPTCGGEVTGLEAATDRDSVKSLPNGNFLVSGMTTRLIPCRHTVQNVVTETTPWPHVLWKRWLV